MELLKLTADPRSTEFPYAMVQLLTPRIFSNAKDEPQLSPILDMLNVRYVVLRGKPPPDARPLFTSADYWVVPNGRALPRVFVPHHVETVADNSERLQKMGSPDFDAREIAYVEKPVDLTGLCLGSAQITNETPTRITVSLNMETPGLVVLADLWNKGWHAALNGRPVPILRANHAIRGVVVPAGRGTLDFHYEPASFCLGTEIGRPLRRHPARLVSLPLRETQC